MADCDSIVVGAGPAGLAAAFWLSRREPSRQVAVLEAAPVPGGWLRSERRDGYLCEHGPQALRPDAAFDELARALALDDAIVPAAAGARRRWIGRDGRLCAVPAGPLGVLTTPLLSWRGKLRLLRERQVPPLPPTGAGAGESVAAFVARRFGNEVAALAHAMVAGIYAGDADRLEVESALPLLVELERSHGSVLRGLRARRRAAAPARTARPPLLTFRGGMQGLIARLALALGDRIETGTAVTAVARDGDGYCVRLAGGAVRRAPHVVLACPAQQSARLLAAAAPQLAAELDGIAYASVANVWLGLRDDRRPSPRRGFGFLLEPRADTPVLGVLYCSDVFPEHAPAGATLLRAMVGGTRHPQAVDLDDDRLVALARAEVERHWGGAIDVAFRHVVRVRRAIPQYDRGHGARLQRIDAGLHELPGLQLRGNGYRGVAVTAQLGSALAPVAPTPSPSEPWQPT